MQRALHVLALGASAGTRGVWCRETRFSYACLDGATIEACGVYTACQLARVANTRHLGFANFIEVAEGVPANLDAIFFCLERPSKASCVWGLNPSVPKTFGCLTRNLSRDLRTRTRCIPRRPRLPCLNAALPLVGITKVVFKLRKFFVVVVDERTVDHHVCNVSRSGPSNADFRPNVANGRVHVLGEGLVRPKANPVLHRVSKRADLGLRIVKASREALYNGLV